VNALEIACLAIVVGLGIYLVAALLYPEKFQ
jgi:K+-transporting ATPase KdpF subunit